MSEPPKYERLSDINPWKKIERSEPGKKERVPSSGLKIAKSKIERRH